jgi:hypothetical protein
VKMPAVIGSVPGRSLWYGILCLAGIFILVVGGIWPVHRFAVRLQSDATRLKGEIREQEALLPVYMTLNRMMRVDMPQSLLNPPQTRLPQASIADIPSILSVMARECDVEAVSVVPQIQSIAGGQGVLLVDGAFSGDLDGFRKLFIKLGSLPYVRHVEELILAKTAQRKDLKLKIWLAIEMGGL